jgi:hypothetical protein
MAALSPLPQVALSAARSWLEDAEVQVHNCQSILQRADAMATDNCGAAEVLAEPCNQVAALSEQVRRAVQSIETAIRTCGPAGTALASKSWTEDDATQVAEDGK